MQSTQKKHSEYSLTTNSVKLKQQKTFDHCHQVTITFATNSYCTPPTCYIGWKLKQALKTSITDTNTSSQTFAPSADSFMNDSLLQPVTHFSRSLLQFTWQILFWSLLHCFPHLVVIRTQTLTIRRPHNILPDDFGGLRWVWTKFFKQQS